MSDKDADFVHLLTGVNYAQGLRRLNKTAMYPTDLSSPDKEVLRDVLLRMDNLMEILGEPEHVPKNILLVGQPGAGKSALINLIHSCIRGRFEQIVETGSGECSSHTTHLRFFANLGLSKRRFEEFRERYKDHLPKNFHLPTIIDMPGLELDAKVIKYVMSGVVLPDSDMREFMTNKALSLPISLRESKLRRVDRVIFVASILDDINEKLFTDVLKFVRGNEGRLPCIPYYLALTQIDRAQNPLSESENRTKENLLKLLMLSGEDKLRVQEIVSYCREDKEDPKRDNAYATNLEKHLRGLQLLCKVLDRRDVIAGQTLNPYPVHELTPYLDHISEWMGAAYRSLSAFEVRHLLSHVSIKHFVIVIVLVVVIIPLMKIQRSLTSVGDRN